MLLTAMTVVLAAPATVAAATVAFGVAGGWSSPQRTGSNELTVQVRDFDDPFTMRIDIPIGEIRLPQVFRRRNEQVFYGSASVGILWDGGVFQATDARTSYRSSFDGPVHIAPRVVTFSSELVTVNQFCESGFFDAGDNPCAIIQAVSGASWTVETYLEEQQVIGPDGTVSSRWLKSSNNGDASNNSTIFIRVETIAPVPAPPALAMAMAGFVALALTVRRRRGGA